MLAAAFLAPVLVVVLAVPVILIVILGGNGHPGSTACDSAGSQTVHADGSWPADTVVGTLDDAKLANAQTIISVGQQLQVPGDGIVIALATAAQESGWRNVSVGDAAGPDSRGLFQQRDSWGPLPVRMDPAGAARLFYQALLAVTGWQQLGLGVAAQRVQRSADPTGAWYSKHEEIARYAYAQLGGDASQLSVSGCIGSAVAGSADATDTYGPYWASLGRSDVDPWSFYWGECTSYAAWMVRSTSQYTDFTNNWHGQHFGNAKEWPAAARHAGLTVDTTPAVGSIAVHLAGASGSYPNGHVAYVSRVYPDGNIDVTEYNFAGHHIFGTRTNLPALSQFDEFIHSER
jgi:surface antigen